MREFARCFLCGHDSLYQCKRLQMSLTCSVTTEASLKYQQKYHRPHPIVPTFFLHHLSVRRTVPPCPPRTAFICFLPTSPYPPIHSHIALVSPEMERLRHLPPAAVACTILLPQPFVPQFPPCGLSGRYIAALVAIDYISGD